MVWRAATRLEVHRNSSFAPPQRILAGVGGDWHWPTAVVVAVFSGNPRRPISASTPPEMQLAGCATKIRRYDTCFLKWYSEKYLRGAEKDNKECEPLFKQYQKCLGAALKQRGIDKLLDEAREDNKENDARLTQPPKK
ncbi:hypothetical protein PWT90_06510 [Aphanocladium album]|nr:hypothetical protein PWT90_06510 [Aphanocladium album]